VADLIGVLTRFVTHPTERTEGVDKRIDNKRPSGVGSAAKDETAKKTHVIRMFSEITRSIPISVMAGEGRAKMQPTGNETIIRGGEKEEGGELIRTASSRSKGDRVKGPTGDLDEAQAKMSSRGVARDARLKIKAYIEASRLDLGETDCLLPRPEMAGEWKKDDGKREEQERHPKYAGTSKAPLAVGVIGPILPRVETLRLSPFSRGTDRIRAKKSGEKKTEDMNAKGWTLDGMLLIGRKILKNDQARGQEVDEVWDEIPYLTKNIQDSDLKGGESPPTVRRDGCATRGDSKELHARKRRRRAGWLLS